MPRRKFWKRGRCHKKNAADESLSVRTQSPPPSKTLGSQSPPESMTFGSQSPVQSMTLGSQSSTQSLTFGSQTVLADTCSEHNSSYSTPNFRNSSVLGTFNQSHPKFHNNAGKQCVANSCVAVLYDKVNDISCWNFTDLDRILEAGNELYGYIRNSLGVQEIYLLVSELPKTLDLFRRTFRIKLGESLTGFVSDDMKANFECDILMPMEKALKSMLTTFQACFVTFAMSTFAIIKRNQEFYVFDSHSRSVFGTQTDDGKSVLIKYKCIADVYDHCKRLASSMNISLSSQFEVTGLSVEVLHQSTTEKQIIDESCMSENEEVTIVSTEKVDYPFQALSSSFCTDICSQFGIKCEQENPPDLVCAKIIGKPCKTRAIVMDGNCFFRAVSYSISGTEINHRKLRLAVVKHLKGNATSYISYLRQPFQTVEEYIRESRMKYVSTWATEVEIQATSDMLGIDIYIFSTTWLRYSTKLNQNLPRSCGALYLKLHEQHYEVVLCVEQLEENQRFCTGDCYGDFVPSDDQTTTDQAEEMNVNLLQSKPITNEYEKRKRKREYRRSNTINKQSKNNKELRHITANLKRKARYHEDEEYRNRKRACTRERYTHDQQYKESLKSSSTKRYTQDPEHREYVKTYSIDKYRTDLEHKKHVKAYSIDKYRTDLEHKKHLKAYSIDKYRTDLEYKKHLKAYSIDKYRTDLEHKKHVKAYSIDKYRTDMEHKKHLKAYSIDKYRTDLEHKKHLKAYSIDKYRTDLEHKKHLKAYSIDKYRTDMEHKKHVKDYSIDKYRTNSEHQEFVKTYNIEKYANNQSFKERAKARSTLKYNACIKDRQNKKMRNVYTRAQKQNNRKSVNTVTSTFNRMKYDAPDHICCVCHRRLFAKQVMNCLRESYIRRNATVKRLAQMCISDKYLHICTNICSQKCMIRHSSAGKLWICFTCHRKIIAGKMPAEAAMNNLQLEPIPEELKCLNQLEQHLIALHIPFSKLMSLPRGSQHGVHGPVVCVPSDIQKTVSVLPRPENEDLLFRCKLKRKLSFKGHVHFKFVKTSRIRNAIRFLKANNKLYADVSFNQEWTNPHSSEVRKGDHDISETLPDSTEKAESEVEDTDTGMYMDSCLQPVDIGQEVLDQHFDNILCLAPAENNNPVKLLMDETNEAKSFPVLFPSGSPTYHDDREARITIARYLHTRLMLADSRFAKNTDYIFYAQYLSEVYQVLSSVSIALRKSFCKALGPKVQAKDLLDTDSLQKMLRTDKAYKFLKPIRGTPTFWQSAQKDLFAMLRQLGIPTWFCSFSAGDTRWPEIIETLQREEGDTRNIDDLDWCEKCSLLRRNPVTAARMFDHRFHCFLKEVIMSPANPIGDIVDYFYRVEFQQRGSPHVHCLFWARNSPKLDQNTDEDIVDFVDQYVSCAMPPEDDTLLFEIVNSVQKHSTRHSKSCRKKGTKCRFNFPRPPSNRTFISRPVNEDDVNTCEQNAPQLHTISKKQEAKTILENVWKAIEQSEENINSIEELFGNIGINQEIFEEACNTLTKKANVVLRRQPSDIWVNQYNADLLRCWDANMDIQYVMDAYSCVVYIISYISKSEREMGLLLDQAQKESLTGNENAKEAMKKLGSVYLHNREVSAQEAVFRVCNLRLKECSRKVLFVPTGENTVKMTLPINSLKSKSKGEDLDADSIFMASSVDRYRNRPHADELTNICLASFCSEYRILSKSEASGSDTKTHNNPVYVLQNGLGHVQKRSRTSPAVIRYPRFSVEKEPEKYYQSMLQLFLPYRSERQLKPEGFESFQNFYDTGAVKCGNKDIEPVKDIVDRNKATFELIGEEVDRAERLLENNGPLEDAWAQICPESEQERLECLNTPKENNTDPQDDIPDLVNSDTPTKGVEIRQPVPSRDEARTLLRSLNDEQRKIFYTVREWCLKKASGKDPESFYLYLTGGAGTGKSHAIKCIQYEASRILAPTLSNPDDISVLITAPTGVAAFNINASTIHSTFSIAVDSKLPYQPLGDEKLNSLRARMGSLHILIIDEISMVDQKLFAYIHGRLRQIKQRRDFSPFAKVSVIAIGDFYQLSPVKGKPLYAESAGLNLWTDLFRIAELTQIMRQKNGDFAQMLNRLRKHKRSEPLQNEDIVALRKCETGEESDALHICATNKEVDEYNLTKLKSSCTDLITVDAEDFYRDAKTGKMERRENQYIRVFNTNLPRRITLAAGARVMLTKNIDVSDGLVNGVFGSVSYISQSPNLGFPSIIYVVFDNPNVGGKLKRKEGIPQHVPPNSTPILPQEDRVTNGGGVRHQFPLKLAYACSIHKIQGSTLNQVVVSLDRIFAAGQAYVALSRVTSLDGLIIQNFKESSIYCNEKVAAAMDAMPNFFGSDVDGNQQQVCKCEIMLHNIQGIKSHIEDMKSDNRFMGSTFICLTETWLSANDPQGMPKIETFTFHHRPRQVCYDDSEEAYSNLSQQSHGGVGLYYKNNIDCEFLNLSLTNLEHLAFYVADANVVVVVIYRPSSYKMKPFKDNLRHMLNELNNYDCGCIVMGDFNEDILRCSSVADLMTEYRFTQHVNNPTTEGCTLIDHVYGKGVDKLNVRIIPTYFSYHEAISIQIC